MCFIAATVSASI